MGDTYIKLNDALPEHRKIVAAGGDAGWLHVCGLAYASRNLSDGRIPIGMVPRLSDRQDPMKLAERLCDVRLWHAAGHACDRCPQPDVDEFIIHDYLEHQRSADHVAELKEKRAAAGRRGGSKKAANARGGTQATSKQPSSKLLAECQDSAEANGTPDTEAEEVLRTSHTEAEAKQPQAAAPARPREGRPPLHVVDDPEPHHRDPRFIGNDLLNEHIAACSPRPPRKVLQKTGEQIDDLVDEDVPAEFIRAGLAMLRARPKLGPGVLPNLVHEARFNATNPQPVAPQPIQRGRSGANVHLERAAGDGLMKGF